MLRRTLLWEQQPQEVVGFAPGLPKPFSFFAAQYANTGSYYDIATGAINPIVTTAANIVQNPLGKAALGSTTETTWASGNTTDPDLTTTTHVYVVWVDTWSASTSQTGHYYRTFAAGASARLGIYLRDTGIGLSSNSENIDAMAGARLGLNIVVVRCADAAREVWVNGVYNLATVTNSSWGAAPNSGYLRANGTAIAQLAYMGIWLGDQVDPLLQAFQSGPWAIFEATRSVLPLSVATGGTHPSSGALVGQGAAAAGSATRTREHPASGMLTGQGAALAGSAARATPGGAHDTTGALVGQGSTVAGAAAHIAVHGTSGALAGPGALIAGSAARVGAAVTHATSGEIVGPGALVSGDAVGPSRRHAGSFPRRQHVRKGYIIKGERYWLTGDELQLMVAQMLTEVSRSDVKEITAGKPKTISKREWKAIKAEPAPSRSEDEDETLLLMI